MLLISICLYKKTQRYIAQEKYCICVVFYSFYLFIFFKQSALSYFTKQRAFYESTINLIICASFALFQRLKISIISI